MSPQHLCFGLVLLFCTYSVHAKVQQQNQQYKALEDTVKSLVNTVKALQHETEELRMKNGFLEEKLKVYERRVNDDEPRIKAFCKEEDNLIKEELNKLRSANLPSVHRRQAGASAIAFSSYLDHDLDGIGTSQVIVFNQIQLNDGNGYNKHTGAFTVPVTGVYVFTFFIGERDSNQMYVKLSVNGVEKSDAVVETVSHTHDAQGGNVVIVKVSKGDAVMIEQHGVGSHLEGSDRNRLSTFSGFLLYETETVAIVGK